tara:strand:- start:2357 stop:2581 length:225 start_codon:yes stop_codon:yes gene_type:complete
MNVFDAVPMIVKEQFEGYDREEITPKQISYANHRVWEHITMSDTPDNRSIVNTMIVNGLTLLCNDPKTFNEVMF